MPFNPLPKFHQRVILHNQYDLRTSPSSKSPRFAISTNVAKIDK
jgi:hypothetical protein